MLILLSPSKAMDFTSPTTISLTSQPEFDAQAQTLVSIMQTKSVKDLQAMMSLSENLATLNEERFSSFFETETPNKQAILAFTGDTYKDIPLEKYSEADFEEAQHRVRILSGLYGMLKPLDLISPYRLEMGTKVKTEHGGTLYAYWGQTLVKKLRQELEAKKMSCVVNLASKEYAKAAKLGGLGDEFEVVEPVFKDEKSGTYKVVSFYAKRARGMMADFIVRHRLKEPEDLQEFNVAGYQYDADSSTKLAPVFLRSSQ